MAKDFAENHYSFKHFLRTLMRSSAYQLSSRFEGEWKPEYTTYYSRKYVRMLSAAELHDAIVIATNAKDPLAQSMSDPGRAAKDTKSFMRVFGQSNRDDMPKKVPQSSLQAMLLMQSKLISMSRVDAALDASKDDAQLVNKLYLSTLSRQPTDPELQTALQSLKPDRKKGAENLQWALINTPEFLFNY